jgi:hypothetical protein
MTILNQHDDTIMIQRGTIRREGFLDVAIHTDVGGTSVRSSKCW